MIDLSSIPNDLQGNALRRVLENYQNSLTSVEEDVNNVAEDVSNIEEEIINPDLPISTPFIFETGMLNSSDITSEEDFEVKTGINKTLVLERYVWRDEYPTVLINAGSATAPDEVDITIGSVQRKMRAFDGDNTEERLSGSFEIPHDMAIDVLAIPEVHVHWRPSTSGTGIVKWFFDWEYSPPEGAPIAMTTIECVEEITADNQHWHKLTTFGHLPQPTTPFGIGGKIGFNIRRTPTDDNDTYPADVYLEQIALHIPIDTLGSRQIYIK